MTADLAVLVAAVVPVAAAVRSTWSPCGLSMLSTITPMGERGRGHRYRATAAWFVVGAVLGGPPSGGSMAACAVRSGRADSIPGGGHGGGWWRRRWSRGSDAALAGSISRSTADR